MEHYAFFLCRHYNTQYNTIVGVRQSRFDVSNNRLKRADVPGNRHSFNHL